MSFTSNMISKENHKKQKMIFIIGAAKCGTTSVHSNLVRSESVFNAVDVKEPNFLLSRLESTNLKKYPLLHCIENMTIISEFNEYKKYTGIGSDKVAIDGSVNYYMFPELVTAAISELNVEPYIIFIARDPVDRAVSAFNHRVAAGFEHDSADTCIIEELEGKRNVDDIMGYYNSGSTYRNVDKIFRENFKNYLLMSYSDYEKNPLKFCNHILSYIGVKKIATVDKTRMNVTGKVFSWKIQRILDGSSPIRMLLRPIGWLLSVSIKRRIIIKLKGYNIVKSNTEVQDIKRSISKHMVKCVEEYSKLRSKFQNIEG